MENKQLLSLLQHGNEEAFTIIYKKYYQMLYQLSFNYLKDRDLAEDIIQQVFLKLWEIRSHVIIIEDLGSYLYTMAKNVILQTIRQKNKDVLEAYEMYYLQKNEKTVLYDQRKTALYKAIYKLPIQKKAICLMKLNEQASNEEISLRLGISVQTVKNHYNQSISFIRKNIGEKIILIAILIKHLL